MLGVLRLTVVLTFFLSLSAFASSNHHPIQFLNDRDAKKTLKCLTDNIYYEAGNQSVIGKIAVAYTTLNRVYSSYFPDNICDVVYEKTGKTCQFSWVCERRKYKKIRGRELEVYNESKQVAIAVLTSYNQKYDPTSGSLFYHAYYVDPRWRRERLVRIEDHIFYR